MKVLVLVLLAVAAEAQFSTTGVKIALKIYDECSKSGAFSLCLKRKAVTFLDRLSRMEKFTLGDHVLVTRVNTPEPSEEKFDVQRGSDAEEKALNALLLDKAAKFVASRNIQVSLPISEFEGRGKKKGMMGHMMMGMAGKMMAMIPMAIAGLFLLAGKALITAKIALLIAGIIAIKKLFAKKGGGGGGGHGWNSGGGGGGWHSSGGGWDKRSLDDAQKLAYKAYAPK